MSRTAQRELVHKVNNLLAVIYTQAAADAGRSQECGNATDALSQILAAAESTVPFVRRAQAELENPGDESGEDEASR